MCSPEEIKLHIMSYCTSFEARTALHNVCREFRRLGLDESRWLHSLLHFNRRVKLSDILAAIRRFGPHIKHLVVDRNYFGVHILKIMEALRESNAHPKSLTFFNFDYDKHSKPLPGDFWDTLISQIEAMPSVEYFGLGNIGGLCSASQGKVCASLKSLGLTGLHDLDDHMVSRVSEIFPALEYLSMRTLVGYSFLSREGLGISLGRMKSLRGIFLGGSFIYRSMLQNVYAGMPNCEFLGISTRKSETLSEKIFDLKHLQVLFLQGDFLITDEVRFKLASREACFPNLHRLVICARSWNFKYDFDFLKAVVNHSPNLKWLVVYVNCVTLRWLAEVLRSTSIKVISVIVSDDDTEVDDIITAIMVNNAESSLRCFHVRHGPSRLNGQAQPVRFQRLADDVKRHCPKAVVAINHCFETGQLTFGGVHNRKDLLTDYFLGNICAHFDGGLGKRSDLYDDFEAGFRNYTKLCHSRYDRSGEKQASTKTLRASSSFRLFDI